jgi:TonB family protein
MKRTHNSLVFVAAAVCSTLIPSFMRAQEGEVTETHVLPSGFVMKFERIGGYAGTRDSFWIYPDGRVINGAGRSAKISPDDVTEWRKNFTPVVLKTPPGFSIESLCMECYVYLITIHDEDGTRTIRFSSLLRGSSEEEALTFSGMNDRLLHLVWSPPTGALLRDQEQSRPIKREPIRIGTNIQESRLIYRVEPVYPDEAKSARLSGKVVLSVTADEQGLISDVKVKSSDPILAESAVAAVKQWRYRPTLLDGEPVPVSFAVTILFSFREGNPLVRIMGRLVESGGKALYGIEIYYNPRKFGRAEGPAIAAKNGTVCFV